MVPHTATEPWTPLATWYAEAQQTEPRVPDAIQIATVGASGRPSIRTVLMKSFGPEGVIFYTNLGSRKAQDLAHTPYLSGVLHWKDLERQVLLEGPVTPLDDATADAYFASRGRGSQLGAWASRQSAPLARWEDLLESNQHVVARFEGRPVPRPPFWSGFRVMPSRMEFWQGRADRLHQRWVFHRELDGWRREMIQP
jgi:pyridoxamine 5'-phosphate oxidase